ncbi:MAG: DUF1080 domain-containing protein [Planctomycetaceae bacterium]|jgi:hypothetical protein|nr:DUF1080 domain-containing protein [Planctomycetaceae bacterium]
MSRKITAASAVSVVVLTALSVPAFAGQDWKSGIPWQKPPVVSPAANPSDPPSGAVILFNGKDLAAWDKDTWLIENGELVCNPQKGTLATKQKFGSVQLHIEFAIPQDVSGKGQQRGNSGVFWGNYEVQVLDSHDGETYYDGQCGAIYKQCPPLVNVCRKPGEWQSYDIIFNRPELKMENGIVRVLRPAYITVLQNGVLIINHHQILGTTFFNRPPAYEAHADKMPISLQDHGNKTRFRNIWVREIPDTDAHPEPVKPAYYE